MTAKNNVTLGDGSAPGERITSGAGGPVDVEAEAKKRAEELKEIQNDPERKRLATNVAQYAVERLNNIHGSKFGPELVEQFAQYTIEQAVDIPADVLAKHASNLAAMKLIDPDGWAKRKPWLSAPKGRRLLKALMNIVREADKASEDNQ